MKMLRNIAALVLAVLLCAPVVAFANTDRLGASEISFNRTKYMAKTAAYTITTSDNGAEVGVTCTSANIVITLPSVESATASGTLRVKIKKADSTTYTVIATPATGDTVGFESTRVLNYQNAYMVLHTGTNNNWEVEFESPYIAADYEAGTVTFYGIGSYTSDTVFGGTTPLVTIGDSGDEDAVLLFDGQAADDFFIGFDTTDDDLHIGYGSTPGTQDAITITDAATPGVSIINAFDTQGATTLGNAVTDSVTITGAIVGASPLILDGTTDNTNELTITLGADPGADYTLTLPATSSAAAMISSLTTNDVNVANSVWGVSNGLAFGGATGADGFEVTVSPGADPSADVAIALPTVAGTLANIAGGGAKKTVTAGSGTTTITIADCGKVYTAAADADGVFNLPAIATAGAGCVLTFFNIGAATNNLLTINPDNADSIFGTITLAATVVVMNGSAGDAVSNTKGTSVKGDSMTLVSTSAGWMIQASTGIWADIN